MTKNERAQKLKEILTELLVPEAGGGKLFVEVHARSANNLCVEILNDRAPGEHAFCRIVVSRPNIVKNLFEQLTREE